MRTKHFRDLLVWQKSMVLAREVYRATERFPKDEIFGLRSQIRRSVVSIPSNIAEGHGRLSDPLLRTFLGQARGSVFELETQLQLSVDLSFMDGAVGEELMARCVEIGKMINGLLGKLSE